jgi:methionyl-tRNA formyltransferase
MGTPEFAIPSLQYLVEAGYAIVAVVTAPDKFGGRGMKQVISSPIKHFAEEHGLKVLQPTNLKSNDFLEALLLLKADLQVVVAFRMLPEKVWNMPPMGTINLHGSLLPAYRGAAPIQWAIIRGEKITGVTTFRLRHEIDSGEIILQREVPVLDADDAGSLHDRMMLVGAGLVLATVDVLAKQEATPLPQDSRLISHAPKIHHEDAHINWNKPSEEIFNLIRGMYPYPVTWSILDGMELKIYKAARAESDDKGTAGKIVQQGKKLIVSAGDGALELLEVQLAGKKRMKVRDFLNGYTIKDWSLT